MSHISLFTFFQGVVVNELSFAGAEKKKAAVLRHNGARQTFFCHRISRAESFSVPVTRRSYCALTPLNSTFPIVFLILPPPPLLPLACVPLFFFSTGVVQEPLSRIFPPFNVT